MIHVRGLIKNYGLNVALRGVDLHVSEGEFMSLVGPNGAGKSTLLRIVATLLQPSGGEVSVGGWTFPKHTARVRRHLGLVSHQPLLYRDLTAAENLEFFARLYQLDDIQQRVLDALRKVGLFARQRDPVGGFSRGMVQRLTIARATLHEPDVLLLDEPYTGLDQDAAQLLDSLLRKESNLGRTILLITHDLSHGLEQSDRIAILNRGQIAAVQESAKITEAEFLEQYAYHTRRRKRKKKDADNGVDS